MSLFRRRLRAFAITWIIFQATSLSALVPRACCLAHQMTSMPDCHEKAAPDASITGSGETPSPSMHHHHGQMAQQSPPSSPAPAPAHQCAVRGTCGGPAAALFALLSSDGVLTDSVTSTVDFLTTDSITASRDQLIPQFESPDAPPPRA
jgi:hypothetical protein